MDYLGIQCVSYFSLMIALQQWNTRGNIRHNSLLFTRVHLHTPCSYANTWWRSAHVSAFKCPICDSGKRVRICFGLSNLRRLSLMALSWMASASLGHIISYGNKPGRGVDVWYATMPWYAMIRHQAYTPPMSFPLRQLHMRALVGPFKKLMRTVRRPWDGKMTQ